MGPEVIIATLVPLAFFALIFGIFYIRNRENMALIERGMNPRQGAVRPRPFVNLKYGLLLIGCGLGLLSAYLIDVMVLSHNKQTATTQIINHSGENSHARHKIVITTTGVNVQNNAMEKEDDNSDTVTKKIASGQHITINGDSIKVKDNNQAEENDDDNVAVFYDGHNDNPAIYFALIAIGGGLGLFFSYRIEKKEWVDKKSSDI